MKQQLHISSLAAALLAIGAAGCGGTTRGTAEPAPAAVDAHAGHAAPAPMDAHAGHAMGATGAAITNGGHPWTEADVRFMTTMIGHHAQAIDMARLAPTHGASPSVQTLAARVIAAQQDEIATMQNWLRDRAQPVPEASHAAMHHEGGDHALMPGMLTPAQMAQLDAARGEAFDRLFLTFMIQHHRGAVAMVQQLFGSYGAAQDETVFKFASDASVDQTTEIARMQRMLEALLLGPAAP
jgi:uncharacterized protein (DUF305 family)